MFFVFPKLKTAALKREETERFDIVEVVWENTTMMLWNTSEADKKGKKLMLKIKC